MRTIDIPTLEYDISRLGHDFRRRLLQIERSLASSPLLARLTVLPVPTVGIQRVQIPSNGSRPQLSFIPTSKA